MLVVDDVPEICRLFERVHRRIRHPPVELVTESVAQNAAKAVQDQDFDLIISDYRMKGIDGLDILGAARERHPAGFRVLMTGYNEIPTSLERLRGAAIDAYILKPLNVQDLLLGVLGFLRQDGGFIEESRLRARQFETDAVADATT